MAAPDTPGTPGTQAAAPAGGLPEHLARQAAACEEMGSPLYGTLLRACAADLAAGGPVADVLRPHADARGPEATGLRLLGAVHHLVLTGAAPALAAQYPSTGGTPDDDLVPTFLAVVAEHHDEVATFMASPPQTNEVGRAAALVGGLLHVLAGRDLPVRLTEIGSSAGLNLYADRFRYQQGPAGLWWGEDEAAVSLADAWRGTPPPGGPLRVVERTGTDISPVDLATPGAGQRLLAYVWPDQPARLERLRAALALAAADPHPVQALDAVAAVERMSLVPGHLSVLWHSVMWQYVPPADQQAVLAALERLGARADDESPLLHLALEPQRPAPGAPHEFLVTATEWPGGRQRVLGRSVGHGVPTTWEVDGTATTWTTGTEEPGPA